ncbi:MAG: hypothetical protein U5M51_12835 [Emticicia sp.]|nr:hypothetical protein [Emticicia sp.]
MKKMLLLIIVFLGGCSPKQTQDYQKLCIDFCTLNRENKFSVLFEVTTTESRYHENKVLDLGIFCPYVKGSYMTIQTDESAFINKKTAGSDNFYKCKNGGNEDIKFYRTYINRFKNEYESIKIPQYYYHNVLWVDGNPNLGKFIEFALTEKCKVYYLEDLSTLKPYWKEKFSKFKKVDDKWFYECK